MPASPPQAGGGVAGDDAGSAGDGFVAGSSVLAGAGSSGAGAAAEAGSMPTSGNGTAGVGEAGTGAGGALSAGDTASAGVEGSAGAPPDAGSAGDSGSDAGASAVDPGPPGICPENPGTAPSGALQASLVDAIQLRDYNYRLFEGAVWIDDALYFSDIDPNGGWNSTIVKYMPGSDTAVDFLVDAGSNGLAVDAAGTLYSATAKKREISRYDLATGSQQAVVSGGLNSPNDLVIARDGTIYFSDPQQNEITPPGGQPQVVHVVKDGVDTVLLPELTNPNGLTLSLDESVLYVAAKSDQEGGVIRQVTLQDGLAGEVGTLATGLRILDGMTIDCAGNVYVAEHDAQRVIVFSPAGQEIATIALGNASNNQAANSTNVAFGGSDRKTLYITAVYSLWEIPLQIAGYPY